MNLLEKVSYLKGLGEGLGIDDSTSEGKLFTKIIDVLDEIAAEIEELYEVEDELQAQINEIDEDLAEVEEVVFGDYDDEDFECEDLQCPNCGESICLDTDLIDEDEGIVCPACGHKIDLDLDYDCDCDCCDCEE